MGLDDPAAAGLERASRAVRGRRRDRRLGSRPRGGVAGRADRARVVVEPKPRRRGPTRRTFAAPPAVVWDCVTSPGRRPQWQHGVTGDRGAAGAGRPARRRDRQPLHPRQGRDRRGGPRLAAVRLRDATARSCPIPARRRRSSTRSRSSRTRRRRHPRRARGSPGRARRSTGRSSSPFCRCLDESIEHGLAALRAAIDAHSASRDAAGRIAAPEPPVPESAGRYLSEPISGTA